MMDIVEKLRRQADSDEKAGTLYAHEISREAAAEIERLRKRCSPSRVVMIGDVGHYVSEGVAEGIESLRQAVKAMDILRAENEKLKTEVEEFAVLTSRLARQLKKAAPDNELPGRVADYLKRTGRQGSPLREVGAGRTATVTREMIGAAHDVMLAKGDFVLSANLLERIYLAMEQAAPPPQTPFDTCPTCEALARAVMMDQTGAA